MNEVPKMISTKDLSYITDILNWNYYAVKECHHYYNAVQDNEIKKLLLDVCEMHLDHYKRILKILG